MIDIQYDITVRADVKYHVPTIAPATLAKPNFRKTSPKSHIFVDFGEVLIGLMRFICIFVRLT